MVTLIIMVAVSMMSAKFATLAFLKLKILAHAIPSAAQLPRVWTRYSPDYTKPGSGQSRTRDAAPQRLSEIPIQCSKRTGLEGEVYGLNVETKITLFASVKIVTISFIIYYI